MVASSASTLPQSEIDSLLAILEKWYIPQDKNEKFPLLSPSQIGWARLAAMELELSRGKEDKARQIIASANLENTVYDLVLAELLGRYLLRFGEIEKARKLAKSLQTAWPHMRAAILLLAESHMAENAPEKALEVLSSLSGSLGPRSLVLRGRARFAVGKIVAAKSDLENALIKKAGDHEGLVALAEISAARGDYKKVIKTLSPIQDSKEDLKPRIWYLLGTAMAQKGGLAKAKELLERAKRAFHIPRMKALVGLEMARIAKREGDYTAAINLLTKAQKDYPGNKQIRSQLALLYFETGKTEAALAIAEEDMNGDKKIVDIDSSLNYARIFTQSREVKKAEKILTRIGSLGRGVSAKIRAKADRENGRLAYVNLDAKKAVVYLRKSLNSYSKDPAAWLLIVDVYCFLANGKKARKAYSGIKRNFPQSAIRYLALGQVETLHDRLQIAIKAFTRAKNRLKNGTPRERALVEQWFGRAYYFAEQPQLAQSALEKAISIYPAQSETYFYLGMVQGGQEDWKNAKSNFTKGISMSRGNPIPEFYYYLGEANESLGEREAALGNWKTYLKLAPKGAMSESARSFLSP